MAEIICSTDPKQNLGASKCNKLPGLFAGAITTPANFSIPAATLANPAALKTFLQNALKAGLASRIYLWPTFSNCEAVSEEVVYEETPLTDIRVRQGKYRFRAHISKNLCLHKAMFSHSGSDDRVIFFDLNNNFFMTELSNGDGAGFRTSLINVEKLIISDGSVATKSPVYFVLKDHNEIDDRGLMIPADFVGELIPLTDAEIILSSVLAGSFTATVRSKCDGTPVSGLLLADFLAFTSAGGAQNPTSVTETSVGSGVYNVVRTGNFVDGTVTLRDASLLTVTAFEVLTSATLDVS
jgi:hypothetical protein